jgi:protein phosphatase
MPWSHFLEGDPEDVTLALEDALRNAQDDLLLTANAETAGLGTTMTLALVFWPDLYVAHVGDSRCFLSRHRSLEQLTTDHTLAELNRESGIQPNPRAERILWNAVGGAGSQLEPEVRHMKLESGDVLALLTDGVAEQRDTRELRQLLDREAPSEQLCNQLVAGEGADDRTAIVVRFLPLEESVVGAVPDPGPESLGEHRRREAPKLPSHPRWHREPSQKNESVPARKRLAL